MANKQMIVIERNINAPSAQVWRALTDIKQLKKWLSFFPDFKAEVGFTTEFMLGPDDRKYLHHVTVLEVIPGRKLTYSWDYGGMSPNSSVTFALFDDGDTTRLTLTCSIDPVPTDPPDFMRGTSEGWNYTADELKKFAEGKE
jgi:uncharacterized protein YndB with AHSA1/START domain